MTDNIIFNALLLFFILAPLFDVAVMALLIRAYRKNKNSAIFERLVSAGALFGTTMIISFLAIYRLFEGPRLPDDIGVVLFTGALLFVSVPSLNWLRMYFARKF